MKLACVVFLLSSLCAFHQGSGFRFKSPTLRVKLQSAQLRMHDEGSRKSKTAVFDPLGLANDYTFKYKSMNGSSANDANKSSFKTLAIVACLIASASFPPQIAQANDMSQIFDPSQFQPVCPGSDGVYQILKLTANGLVGEDNVVEYGPLIASVLLRVRLELCVLESFLYEAVVPFIQKKGVSWILPLHENVETFLAGSIFALASNFILLGSTKILSTLFIYLDVLTGFPLRLIGGGLRKFSKSNSPTDVLGTGLQLYGKFTEGSKNILESTDTFVGRYLVVITTAYIAFKFAHFKFFNDIFP